MAILSDYAIGTVSIAANASVVTGTGTAWNIQSFQEGDLLFVDGDVAILSGPPTSATSLPITRPWLGGAKTNVPYRLRYMSDGSRYTNKAQELINLLGDGTLTALATVGSAINKLSYWSAAGVAALTDLSPFARTNIINKVDRASLLASSTGIGVSTNVSALTVVSTDLNNDVADGWVGAASGTTANLPTGAGLWVVEIMAWANGSHVLQTAYQAFGGGVNVRRQFTRERSNALVWSTWDEQFPWTAISGVAVKTASTGYQRLPSGIIFQWGYSTSSFVSFPLVFPNQAMSCVASYSTNNTTAVFSIALITLTTTGATFNRMFVATSGGGGAAGEPFYWQAMGY